MPLNQPLTAESALLLIVDLQVGHMPSVRSSPSNEVVKSAVRLTQLAQAMNLPIIITISKQDGPKGRLCPELAEVSSDIPVVERTGINAWDEPKIRSLVNESGRSQIILCGVALDVGVRLPALGALRTGLSAHIAVDAVGTTDSKIENAALMDLASSGASLTSVQGIGMELLGDVTSDRTSEVLRVLGSAHSASDNPFENPE